MLELVRELIRDYNATCCVIVPRDGPLNQRLEAVGAEVKTIKLQWWCDTDLLSLKKIEKAIYHNFVILLSFIRNDLFLFEPDIICTNTLVIPWGALSAQLMRRPHVWFVDEFGQLDHQYIFVKPFETILHFIQKSSDLIIVMSQAVKNRLFCEVPDEECKTVYCHIDIPTTGKCDDACCFTKPDAFKALILGSISPSKGQKEAILAVRELIRANQNIELCILGTAINSEYLDELKALIADENLGSFVNIIDFTEDPFPAIREADVLLMCSRNEAFGRCSLEAMLSKKPVIGTNAGGTPELIEDGQTGWLYESGNYRQLAEKILWLLKHPKERMEMGLKGYQLAKEKFSKENYGGKVYALLRRLKEMKEEKSSFVILEFLLGLFEPEFVTLAHHLEESQRLSQTQYDEIADLHRRLMIVEQAHQEAQQLAWSRAEEIEQLNKHIEQLNNHLEVLRHEIDESLSRRLIGLFRRLSEGLRRN